MIDRLRRGLKRLLPFAGLALLLILAPILLLTQRGNETLSLLFWYLIWIGNLVFKSMPQLLFWILFLAVALVIAVASLLRHKRRLRNAPVEKQDRAGRVLLLAHAVRRADQGVYFRWRLARFLGELASQATARHGTVPADDRFDLLSNGEWTIPPEVLAYFEIGLGRGLLEQADLFARIARFLRLKSEPSPLDLDPEQIIRFLEDQLEVSYDR